MTDERSFRLAAAAAAAAAVLFVIWVLFGIQGPEVTQTVDDIGVALAPLLAAGACFHAARRAPYGFGRAWTAGLRRAWRLLGAAALSWGLGQTIWTFLELIGRENVPFPSLADVGFMAAVPLGVAGMLAFPAGSNRRAARVRTLLDGVLIATSLLFVAWATWLGNAYRDAVDSNTLEKACALTYPLADFVAITIGLLVLSRSRGRGMVPLAMLTAAFGFLALADTAFAYLTQTESYSTGALYDSGWFIGYLVLLVTALRPAASELRPADGDDDQASLGRLTLPYLPLTVAAATGVGTVVVRGGFDPFLVFIGTGLGLIVLARQIVVLIENRQLTQRLHSTVERLSEREQELREALRRELDASRKLKAADEMKDTFLKAVSHDLRTPLTAMLGVAVTLERTRLNLPKDQALDLIRMLVEKTQKLERLLADLLDLNRLEEGVLEPNRSMTDVRELAYRVVGEVDQLAGWPIDIEADQLTALIDGPKVERIIENLLLNTTRHTPPGTRVWVKALAIGHDLELVVEDAGPGVPPDLAGTIFEPFRRGTPPAQTRGVGIGLSLVARFAELHGGRAWVETRQGGGASFHVRLPNAVSYERRFARV